jgi:predicted ATPase
MALEGQAMSSVPAAEVEPVLPAHKPAFLRRVQIRGYKSIAFCDVTLEPLTILVGRNASGKSNFLDALAFLRDALDGLDSALVEHGGSSVFAVAPRTNRLTFEIEAEFPSYEMDCRAVYRFVLTLNARKQLDVEQESLRLTDMTRERTCSFTASKGNVTWQGLEGFHRWRPLGSPSALESDSPGEREYPRRFRPFRPDRLLLGVLGDQPFIDLAEGLRTVGVFNFQPEAIREPQLRVGSPALKRDGRNLARALEGLAELEPETVEQITTYLNAIVPEIEGFAVVPVADRETIQFTLRANTAGTPLSMYASSMSDGTLRVLATLAAAFHNVLPHGYPGLVAIEEPETALHPAALRALVDALDSATLRTQVLLTTHSAELMDIPTIRPENVRVVQMVEGQTVIGPVDEASIDILSRKLSTLGGLERENQLAPDFDDLDRQRHLRHGPAEQVR